MCGCKEVFRFPHITYPTPLVSALFSPDFLFFFLNVFRSLHIMGCMTFARYNYERHLNVTCTEFYTSLKQLDAYGCYGFLHFEISN